MSVTELSADTVRVRIKIQNIRSTWYRVQVTYPGTGPQFLFKEFSMAGGQENTEEFTVFIGGSSTWIQMDVEVDLRLYTLDKVFQELTGIPLSIETATWALKKVNNAMISNNIISSENVSFGDWLSGLGKLMLKEPEIFVEIASEMGKEITISTVVDWATWGFPLLKAAIMAIETGWTSWNNPFSEIITIRITKKS